MSYILLTNVTFVSECFVFQIKFPYFFADYSHFNSIPAFINRLPTLSRFACLPEVYAGSLAPWFPGSLTPEDLMPVIPGSSVCLPDQLPGLTLCRYPGIWSVPLLCRPGYRTDLCEFMNLEEEEIIRLQFFTMGPLYGLFVYLRNVWTFEGLYIFSLKIVIYNYYKF